MRGTGSAGPRKLTYGHPVPLWAAGLLLTNGHAMATPAHNADGGSMELVQAVFLVLGMVAIGVLAIAALVLWGRKQDHLGEMALFGMRYLLDFERIPQGCEAARGLGRTGDPEALLVLLDVFQDEAAPGPVREAAGQGLTYIIKRSSGLRKPALAAKTASERGDQEKLIRILIENFEQNGGCYVQSAFLIGRAYLRLDRFAEAKKWLQLAEGRNRRAALYGDRIRGLVNETNRRLFAIGDRQFAAGRFQAARAQYAAGAQGLSPREAARYSVHLRLASTSCMRGDFHDAEQALSQILRQDDGNESALALIRLVHRLLDRQAPPSVEQHRKLVAQIREHATAIMCALPDFDPENGGGYTEPSD